MNKLRNRTYAVLATVFMASSAFANVAEHLQPQLHLQKPALHGAATALDRAPAAAPAHAHKTTAGQALTDVKPMADNAPKSQDHKATAVPDPSSLALLAAGIFGLVLTRRRQR